MNRLRKGDNIIVLAGKNKGCKGTIAYILPNKNRVVVEGINLIKKHIKPNPNKGVEGGILEKEAPLHISNIALYNPAINRADRIGFKVVQKSNKKIRYFKSNNEHIGL